MGYENSPKGNIGIKKCGGKYIDIIVPMCYNTNKRKENTMKTGYMYWDTICDYFCKDELIYLMKSLRMLKQSITLNIYGNVQVRYI